MEDRIALILKTKNLNASQFADEIGVQRSSISHVLSGRNKPSLEFVQKILKRYPDINPDWLLFGKGPMYQETNLFTNTSESIPVREDAISKALGRSEKHITPLVPKHRIREDEVQKDRIEENENHLTVPLPEPVQPLNPAPVEPVKAEPAVATRETLSKVKSVEKIYLFFNDRTFREYSPE